MGETTSDRMARAERLVEGAGPADLTVRLDFDDRHRRRLIVTADTGERVLLDLSHATRLRDGDVLALSDGRRLAIVASDEPVADITADRQTLVRLAWHLGNRHTPTALLPDRLRIRRDHVLEAMVTRLGGAVARCEAPFDPEAGAYAGAEHGHHHHAHRHDEAAGGDAEQ